MFDLFISKIYFLLVLKLIRKVNSRKKKKSKVNRTNRLEKLSIEMKIIGTNLIFIRIKVFGYNHMIKFSSYQIYLQRKS
jgi:hypothetical protein